MLHELKPKIRADSACAQKRERRLVDRHDTAGIERPEQEVVPARDHRADRRGVVAVGPAVARQVPEVQHAGDGQQHDQLGPDVARRPGAGRGQRVPCPGTERLTGDDERVAGGRADDARDRGERNPGRVIRAELPGLVCEKGERSL